MSIYVTHATHRKHFYISRRSAIARAAMQSLENQIWRSRLAISTKLKLYNMCILPIFLYGSDCWAISKTDARKIDALNQWCLHMLLGIKWYQFVRSDDVQKIIMSQKLQVGVTMGVWNGILWVQFGFGSEQQKHCFQFSPLLVVIMSLF